MRPLATLRFALLAPLALAAFVSTPVFAQTEIIIRQAQPPERAAMVPLARPGYARDRGHWRLDGAGYGAVHLHS